MDWLNVVSSMGAISKGVKVVFSSDETYSNAVRMEDYNYKKSVVGTISYMPPVFGCSVSSVVVRDLVS